MLSTKALPLYIACDGESASGKSFSSSAIARKYKLFLINSGLLFRYASLLILKHKPKKIIPFIKKKFKNLNYKKITRLNLHTQEISNHVVVLAQKRSVRAIAKAFQKKNRRKHSRILCEGRDAASIILRKNPHYDVAFYFKCNLNTASLRRWRDLKKKVPLKIVKDSLQRRTRIDKSRKISALKKMPDAILIRTDILSKQDVIAKMSKEIDRKLLLKYERNYKTK